MFNLNNQNKAAIGEAMVLARLLLLGYYATITNFTVKNSKSFDIFCRDDNSGKMVPVQVKTSTCQSFHVGMTHAPFFDSNGKVNISNGRKAVEEKVICPWIFVDITGTPKDPEFRFFILSRQQVIDIICSSEEWYLTGFPNRKKSLALNGTINIPLSWLEGEGVKANRNHIEWINPLSKIHMEDNWNNIWV